MNELAITPFNLGMLRFDLSQIYDLADDHPFAGRIVDVPMICYHLSWPGRSLLVDAMAYDTAEIGENILVPDYVPPPPLLAQMEKRGLEPKQVKEVIITHAHFDHYGGLSVQENGRNVPAFPHARHYLGAADWQPEQFDDYDHKTLGLVEKHGLLKLVEGDLDLGDGVTILSAPGETDGHQILVVRAGKQLYYFVGDLYHHEVEFADSGANVYWADEQTMAESKAMIMNLAAQRRALVFFSHIEGAYTVLKDGECNMRWVREE